MRYRYPRNEHPQWKDVPKKCRCSLCRWFDPNPGKALCKNKGAKSKGRRWGLYSDADLRSGHIKKKKPVLQQKSQRNTSGGKVQVVDSTEFRKCNDFQESSPFCGTLDLRFYMLESSKTKRKQTKKNKHNPDLILSTIKDGSLRYNLKYGKNSVVYIEQEPEERSSADLSPSAIPKKKKPRLHHARCYYYCYYITVFFIFSFYFIHVSLSAVLLFISFIYHRFILCILIIFIVKRFWPFLC